MSQPNPAKALRPRDAATLIMLRGDGPATKLLMGKRHADHKFMPNKFVFPGGRVDFADCRHPPARDLHPDVAGKLMAKMRGRPSLGRARGLAMAAVRETFEETGFIIGEPASSPTASRAKAWREFNATGYNARLDGMRFFARAITPPGRPRRFDTRFFTVAADQVCNIDSPVQVATDELLERYWLTIDEALELDLPWITTQILNRLQAALAKHGHLQPGAPVTFQRMIGNNWHYETI